MSVPEGALRLGSCAADVVEIGVFGTLSADARRRIAGVDLPFFGRILQTPGQLLLSVRPGRWLILAAPAAAGATAARWARACHGQGSVVDLSSALAVFFLAGAPARTLLGAGCRLDLEPRVFAAGMAAATQIAQVAVTLAALPDGLLLLTPSSTAQHVREWLLAAAAPGITVQSLSFSFSDMGEEGAT